MTELKDIPIYQLRLQVEGRGEITCVGVVDDPNAYSDIIEAKHLSKLANDEIKAFAVLIYLFVTPEEAKAFNEGVFTFSTDEHVTSVMCEVEEINAWSVVVSVKDSEESPDDSGGDKVEVMDRRDTDTQRLH